MNYRYLFFTYFTDMVTFGTSYVLFMPGHRLLEEGVTLSSTWGGILLLGVLFHYCLYFLPKLLFIDE